MFLLKGSYVRDQIAFFAFHSFFEEVQMSAGYISAAHV